MQSIDSDNHYGLAQVVVALYDDEKDKTLEPYPEGQANARLIVRAVNSHEALVEALEYWLDIAQHDPKYAAWQGKARAALALAKEGE